MADQRLRILVLAPNPWDGPRMNRQHLFSRLAERHSIVYSTGVPFFKGPTRHRPFRALKGHFERTDGLIVDHPPSWLIRNFRLQTLDDTVVALASRRWRSVLDGSHIAYLFHPGFWPHVRHLNASHVVYHAFDMYNRLASWCAEFEAWERQLVERADLVIASSSVIHDRLLALGARQTLLLENAGDYDLFASGASRDEPADLKTIPRPRVGYSGAINQKVALPLVGILAERRPELHFVLIGSVTRLGAEMERALADLRGRPNVHLLGRRPYDGHACVCRPHGRQRDMEPCGRRPVDGGDVSAQAARVSRGRAACGDIRHTGASAVRRGRTDRAGRRRLGVRTARGDRATGVSGAGCAPRGCSTQHLGQASDRTRACAHSADSTSRSVMTV